MFIKNRKMKIGCFSVFRAITFPVEVKAEAWPLGGTPVAPEKNGCQERQCLFPND